MFTSKYIKIVDFKTHPESGALLEVLEPVPKFISNCSSYFKVRRLFQTEAVLENVKKKNMYSIKRRTIFASSRRAHTFLVQIFK